MADLTEKVATMKEGWETFPAANDPVTGIFDSIDRNISRLTEAVEALVANQRAGLSNRNNIASSSAVVREVRNANPPEPGENRSLGYRNGTGSVLANLNGIWRKIDMPYLDGSSPYIWITLAERFFRLGNYTDTERLDLLPVSLQGQALYWFNREMARDPFKDWAEFKRRMRARFGTIKKQSSSEGILKKNSISEVVQATKLSCAVQSTTSLELADAILEQELQDTTDSHFVLQPQQTEHSIYEAKVEASGICVKAVMQVEKKIKAPIVEELQNKSRDGVSTEMKTCGLNDLTSSEKRKLIPSMVLDEIKVEEKVEMSQDWTCISNMNGPHKLFEIAFHETEQIKTKKKQRKCFKSWRFKYKKKSRTREVEISRSLLMQHQVFSLMKCWKYGVSVWHCWRFKFNQRNNHKTLSRPALTLADGRDTRFLQSFSGLEFCLDNVMFFPGYALSWYGIEKGCLSSDNEVYSAETLWGRRHQRVMQRPEHELLESRILRSSSGVFTNREEDISVIESNWVKQLVETEVQILETALLQNQEGESSGNSYSPVNHGTFVPFSWMKEEDEVSDLVMAKRKWEPGGITRMLRSFLVYLGVHNMKVEAKMEERIRERGIKAMNQEAESGSVKETQPYYQELFGSYSWVSTSGKRKLCKDWWFKYKKSTTYLGNEIHADYLLFDLSNAVGDKGDITKRTKKDYGLLFHNTHRIVRREIKCRRRPWKLQIDGQEMPKKDEQIQSWYDWILLHSTYGCYMLEMGYSFRTSEHLLLGRQILNFSSAGLMQDSTSPSMFFVEGVLQHLIFLSLRTSCFWKGGYC